ncbi:MAG TPA: 7-cyano-7-deazaguanine synthase QueC [Bdellovibrionales bacterium]|nr:7-cyano-7-deazaguanine synthase QueC [Bdellovibrionales bacterium]
MSKTSVVLLSSGLDSTVNLYEAREKSRVLLALTFDYGQRAAPREIERAGLIAEYAGVPHKVVDLRWFSDFTNTALVNRSAQIPKGSSVSMDDLKTSNETAKAVWVPNRNGIFMNIAAAYAEGLKADWVVPGFNIEEGATFPDNTQEYLDALTVSFKYSTSNHVEAKCFTTHLNKTEIVKQGREVGAPFNLMWPCYLDGQEPCGQCESCQRFNRAMGRQ